MKRIKTLLILFCCLTGMAAQAQVPMNEEQATAYTNPLEKKKVIHSLIANYKTGWITSDIYTPDGKKSGLNGTGFELGYRALYSSGMGIGFYYDHSETDYPISRSKKENLKLNYGGLSLFYGGPVGRQWIATIETGVGYGHYNDGYISDGGLGLKEGLGVEYQLSPYIGIGIGVDYTLMIFGNQKEYISIPKNYNVTGFKRLSLHAGLRIYLGK